METESRNLEPETRNLLSESLFWLDYCLSETQAAMEVVKDAALEDMRSPGGTPGAPGQGEPVTIEQYAAMCETAAGIITLRGQAARGFRASCPASTAPKQADET